MSFIAKLTAAAALSAVTLAASAGPVAVDEFNFNGNTVDTGSKPLTMQTIGTISYSNTAPAAAEGQAAVFNGSTWVRATGPTINNVKGDFSVSFWMKTSSFTSAGSQWYLGRGLVDAESAGVTTDWGISLLGNKIAFGMGYLDTTLFSTRTVNDNQWHLVSATWQKDSGQMSLYLDGLLNSSTIATSSRGLDRIGQNALTLGGIAIPNNGFVGMLAHVQVFDTVLSAADVAAIANPNAVPEPASVALIGLGLAGLAVRRRRKA